MNAPAVIFIESNTSGTGRLFVQRARALGCTPVVLAADAAGYPYLAQDAIAVQRVDTDDDDALRQCVDRLAAEMSIGGVWSSSEYWIACAARLARERGLSAADPAAIALCRHKGRQRERLSAAGIPCPRFAIVSSIDEARAQLATMSTPVVVKPVDGTGSVAVTLCRTTEAVLDSVRACLARTVNERGRSVIPEVLIEEYISGPEVSVETFGRRVIGITRKHLSAEPVFVEVGHDYPCTLPDADAAAVEATALRALEAVGLIDGPAHVEIRCGAGGPVIVEINGRLAGGFIPELVRLACGIDLIDACLQFCLGRTPDLQPRAGRYSSIRFLMVPADGCLAAVDGVGEAQAMPGIHEVRLYRTPFDPVTVHGDFRDRIGHVIACADDEPQAARQAARACAALSVRLQAAAAAGVSS